MALERESGSDLQAAVSLQELLWTDLENASRGDDLLNNGEDFVVFQCRDGSFEIAHRLIVRVNSSYLAGVLKQKDHPVKVPLTSRCLHYFIEHFYGRESLQLDLQHVIEFYASAKLFQFEHLKRKLKALFETNIAQCLMLPSFFVEEPVESIELFEDVFDDLSIDDRYKVKLIQRIVEWQSKNQATDDFFHRLISKVANYTDKAIIPSTPVVYILQDEVDQDGVRKQSSLRDTHTQRYTDCNVEFEGLSPLSVVKGNKLYAAYGCSSVVVFDFVTGEKLHDIPLSDATGVGLYKDDIYVWTVHELFALDESSSTPALKKIASSSRELLNVCLVNRDEDSMTYVAETWEDSEVFLFSRAKGKAQMTILREGKHRLAGACNGHVFVFTWDDDFKTLLDIKDGEVVREYAIGRVGGTWDSCVWGGNVYVAWEEASRTFANGKCWRIEVIDIENGNRHSIQTSVTDEKTCFVPGLV